MNRFALLKYSVVAAALCLFVALGCTLVSWNGFDPRPAFADDAPQASGSASSSDASELQTVKVGYYESRDFQVGTSDGAQKSGYGYEYLQRVASYAGWRYEYVYGTWQELYQKLRDGEIDLLAGVTKTDEHARSVKFPSASMLSETFYVYAGVDGAVFGDDPASYAGARIGVVAGSTSVDAFSRWLGDTNCGAQPVEFDTFDAMLAAFAAGDIDAFVSSDNVAHNVKGAAPLQIIGKTPYYLAVSNSRPDLLMQLNETLGVMNSQDAAFLNELQTRYAADSSVNVYITAEEKQWMAQHSSLVVGYLDSYLPYCDTDSDGNATGLFMDVLSEIIDKLPGDWAPDIQTRGFENQSDLIDALKNGEIDLAFPVGGGSWYAEQNGFALSTPVVSPAMNLVLSPNFDSESDAPIDSLAVNSHNLLQRLYVEKHFPSAHIVEYGSADECLGAVVQGKVDGTVLNGLRASALLNSRPNLTSIQLPEADDRCFGVAEGNGAFLQLLNRGLGIIGDQFGMEASYDYTAGLFRYTFVDFVRDNWMVFTLLLVLVILGAVAYALHHFRKLIKENEREVEQNRKLEEALEQAERASKAKDELLTNLSHDIRTPLNGILGVVDINGSCDNPEMVRANMEKARVASRQLLSLVDNLLEMSQLRSGSLELGSEVFGVAGVIDDALAEARVRAQESHVNVIYAGHSEALRDAQACGSPAYIRQILVNVLDNAVRYNVEGGRVVLEADVARTQAGFELSCTISDTGVGMSEEGLRRVFEPFSQNAEEARSVYPGAGLGMPIVKSLVELMGGTIAVSSVLGQGTVVSFAVPLAQATPEQCARAAAGDAPSIEGMRVMIAEDNDLNMEIAKAVVERAGAKVVAVARDGRLAVETFAASPEGSVDAILMDIMMPNMDGYEATRKIRLLNRDDANEVAIVALTAKVFESDRNEALAAGMNDHLPKPLDPEQLVGVLSRYRR